MKIQENLVNFQLTLLENILIKETILAIKNVLIVSLF